MTCQCVNSASRRYANFVVRARGDLEFSRSAAYENVDTDRETAKTVSHLSSFKTLAYASAISRKYHGTKY